MIGAIRFDGRDTLSCFPNLATAAAAAAQGGGRAALVQASGLEPHRARITEIPTFSHD